MELVLQSQGSDRKTRVDCCSGVPHCVARGFRRRCSPNQTQIIGEESERSSSSMHHVADVAPIGGLRWGISQI
jgi:hypothetical protein